MAYGEHMVKKSIYFDESVYEALKSSAQLNRRSVTKQLDFLLRAVLLAPEGTTGTLVYHSFDTGETKRTFRGPDPKVKPRLKAVESSKKLT